MAALARYVLALDQGTTSSRAVLFDGHGQVLARRGHPLHQIYPRPGWVEHDPEEIWQSQVATMRLALADAGLEPAALTAIGIANQRETTLVWERASGRPVGNAIVWQDRRTAAMCAQLAGRGLAADVRGRTGLPIDPYFSGTKLAWILERVPDARARAEAGDLLFGTVDTWLVYRLTGGRVHATDCTNASRTLLYNIHELAWDDAMLGALAVPRCMLPRVVASSGVVAETDPAVVGAAVPIAGIAGDQQAALLGQACVDAGAAKNTYGTGSFLLMNTGTRAVASDHGLLTTIAWRLGDHVTYALEGSAFVAGAAIQWLRDGLGIIARPEETDALARSVPDTGGVYVVPAFAGLGAPHWDPNARGVIVGLTGGSGRAHLVRATLEAIAYQCRDLLDAMRADAGLAPSCLRVDGGAAANDFLMQFQADLLGVPVERPPLIEATARGAAYLAGLASGVWRGVDAIRDQWRVERRFAPAMAVPERERLYGTWQRAVERARGWALGD